MLTMNCDAHTLLKNFRKPKRDKERYILQPDKQDKRTVVPIECADWDVWIAAIDQSRIYNGGRLQQG